MITEELLENPRANRESLAKSITEQMAKLLALTHNPKLGKKFGMEADYSEVIEFFNYPYNLNTVAIGVVSYDGKQRYVGFASSQKDTGYLSHLVEKSVITL